MRLCSACFQKAYRLARKKKAIPLPTILPGSPLDHSVVKSSDTRKRALQLASAQARCGLNLAILQDEYYSGRGCAILLSLDDNLLDTLIGHVSEPLKDEQSIHDDGAP